LNSTGEHGQVLVGELLLEIDGVGADDGFLAVGRGEQDRRDQVRQALAHAGSRLDRQVLALHQGLGDGHGHLLLLRAILEILRPGEQAFGRKNLLNLGDQIRVRNAGLGIDEADHNVGQGSRLSLKKFCMVTYF